jgi:hypothetical protein
MGITIDGKEWRLRYNHNAVADAEEYSRRGFASMMSEDHIGFSTVRVLLWAGLRAQEPGLTIQRAGLLMDTFIEQGGTHEELMTFILQAVNESKMFRRAAGNVPSPGDGEKPG